MNFKTKFTLQEMKSNLERLSNKNNSQTSNPYSLLIKQQNNEKNRNKLYDSNSLTLLSSSSIKANQLYESIIQNSKLNFCSLSSPSKVQKKTSSFQFSSLLLPEKVEKSGKGRINILLNSLSTKKSPSLYSDLMKKNTEKSSKKVKFFEGKTKENEKSEFTLEELASVSKRRKESSIRESSKNLYAKYNNIDSVSLFKSEFDKEDNIHVLRKFE